MPKTVTDTWYRISEPGKDGKVVKAGTAALQKATADRTPGRPKVAKVASPGVYSDAQFAALGLPSSATDKAKPKKPTKPKSAAAEAKARAKAADKAKAPDEDK